MLALPLRIPLIFLPGPGRDEAAYYLWARQAHFDYAPLTIGMVRILDSLGIPALAAIRLPSILVGLGCIVLFDRLLRAMGTQPAARRLATVSFAITPWQTLVGSTLHPDALLLAMLLIAALALRRQNVAWIALAGGLAALAKPTGLLLLPALALGLWQTRTRGWWTATLAMLLIATPAWTGLDAAMLHEMRQFGRFDDGLSGARKLALSALGILAQAAPLLLIAAAQGLFESVRQLRARRAPGESGVFAMAASLIGFFATATIWSGQFKGNWMLPGLVLSWPRGPLALSRAWIAILLTLSFGASALLVYSLRSPDFAARIERRTEFQDLYVDLAGAREQRVSPTRSFSQRFEEFADRSALAASVLESWRDSGAMASAPSWIISDDYGLACQLAYHWRDDAPRVLVPGDGMFDRELADARAAAPAEMLLLTSMGSVENSWPQRAPAHRIARLKGPGKDGFIEVGVFASR